MKLPNCFPVEVKKGNSTVKIYRSNNKGYHEFKVAYYADGKRKLETFAHRTRYFVGLGDVTAAGCLEFGHFPAVCCCIR